MKNRIERMNEFLNYHIYGDGECNTKVLKVWADRHCNTLQDIYELCYFFSITYCVFSAIIMYLNKKSFFDDCESFSDEYRDKLIFQSDRKYIKMKDSFKKANMCFVHNNRDVNLFLDKVSRNGKIVIKDAVEEVYQWDLFGRFSAFLFLEAFIGVSGIGYENYTIDWKNGDTATSGLLNLYCFDEYANEFDRSGKLLLKKNFLDKLFENVIVEVKGSGGSESVLELETSLCAYRKFYKGSRYNGYYLDRMLEEMYFYKNNFNDIFCELIEIRKDLFDVKYLGEVSGWNCIRRELKKWYLKHGKIF